MGAVFLMAHYIARRFPAVEWRTSLAAMTAVVFGLNAAVFMYAPLAQPYGLCLLLITGAFRLATVRSSKTAPAFASGMTAGAGCAASLLTAPVLPVLAVWIAWTSRAWRRSGAFIAGALVGLLPLLAAFVRWPRQTFLGVIAFHLFHRQSEWEDWPSHDAGVLTAWLLSAQTFALVGSAVAGALFLRRCGWERNVKEEFSLCAVLAGSLCLFLATGHPTFGQYFLLAVPFASVLAAAGVYAVARHHSRAWAVAVVISVTAAGLGRSLFDDRNSFTWSDFAPVAKVVQTVTSPGARLYADEHVYFLADRSPPSGMEWRSSHKIEKPPPGAPPLVPQSELDRLVRSRFFPTLETCEEDDIDRLCLRDIYPHEKRVGDCFVFW
jgi:hypothetical protein